MIIFINQETPAFNTELPTHRFKFYADNSMKSELRTNNLM